jgi:hypothetical protein
MNGLPNGKPDGLWDHAKVYRALRDLGLTSGTSVTNPKVYLYPQSQDVAILYSPESQGFKRRPLGFQARPEIRRKGGWRDDVFEAIKDFIPPNGELVRTRGWMEFDLLSGGWSKLAAALGLDQNDAEREFDRLPEPIKRGFSPERDTPTTATRLASVGEVRQDHGVVTNKLEELLRLSGQVTGNDKRQDLLLLQDGGVSALFEVKSSAETQSVYTCIGQLMYHGCQASVAPLRVAVLPASIAGEAVERLEKLGIRLVTFRLVNGVPQFNGLEVILRELAGE